MSMSKKKLQTFNGEIDIDRIIRVLETERECVSRDCDRDCGKCDLVLDSDWIKSAYDDALFLLGRKGKWKQNMLIDKDTALFNCGYCLKCWEAPRNADIYKMGFHYCPNCGARMYEDE